MCSRTMLVQGGASFQISLRIVARPSVHHVSEQVVSATPGYPPFAMFKNRMVTEEKFGDKLIVFKTELDRRRLARGWLELAFSLSGFAFTYDVCRPGADIQQGFHKVSPVFTMHTIEQLSTLAND